MRRFIPSIPLFLAGVFAAGCGEPWYVDEDGDGFGSEEGKGHRPDDAVTVGGDCDDADAEVHPKADELCDGVDTNCDGDLPADESADEDTDGWVSCVPDRHWAGSDALEGAGDCDDADVEVHPEAEEGCDGIDTDCDGAAGDDEVDGDNDGYVECEVGSDWKGAPGLKGGDCEDDAAAAHPGGSEICDGLDDDCNGSVPSTEIDDDGDQHVECANWTGDPAMGGGDCDDANPSKSAGLPELCNGVDDDCDNLPAEDEIDHEGDHYVPCEITGTWEGDPSVIGGGDCGDEYVRIYPGAEELRDGYDSNCDGTYLPEEVDDDGDGYVEMPVVEPYWVGPDGMMGLDCDDTNPDVHPGNAELCDGIDNNCDGQPDPSELDQDEDGLVGCAYDPLTWQGPASVTGGGDCYDFDPDVRPGGNEVCDRLDNDCDGLVDDDDPGVDPATKRTFYQDDDADSFGLDAATITACRLPQGYAPAGGDCDDTERHVYPFSREECDGIDNDCDNLIDDDDEVDPYLALEWFPDDDRDGYGDGSQQALVMCEPPDQFWAEDPRDCDDGRGSVHWNAAETCNGVDDDCDGHPDLPGGVAGGLGCDFCTGAGDFNQQDIRVERYDPCVLDPRANDLCGAREHGVRYRTDASVLRPELFIFLPPSEGQFNNNIMNFITHAGYRTILFGQSNQVHMTEVCEDDPSPTCQVDFTNEAIYGVDTSPHLTIDGPDSLMTRLEVLLNHLVATHPGDGWERYVDPDDGSVVWDDIIVSGWSKAVTYTLALAETYPVSGVFLFSNPNDPSSIQLNTSDCRLFALYHEDEYIQFGYPSQVSYEAGFRSMGMDGPTLDMDTAPWPWPVDAQIHSTAKYDYDRDDCSPHKAVAFDNCLDEKNNLKPYIDLFCRMAEPDPLTCP